MQDGKEIFNDVKRISKEDKRHYTEKYLNLFNKALSLLKTVTEQEKLSFEHDCIMEIRCKQVVDWFKTLNAPKNHSEKFIETMKIFDSLPYRYMLVHEKTPTALYYADEKYIKKEVLSSAKDLW